MEFEITSPESQGIASEQIVRFLERLEKNELPMHSMILMRHGKIVAETYYRPYSRKELHRMFSVTKSMVSLAIGLLCEEGKLSLEDRIAAYFPEKLPKEGVHPYIDQITIRDMLCMATAHEKTTYKQVKTDDWVSTFFSVMPSHLPGTVFSYDTSSTHTLAALVEKLSGKELLAYLREKFLDEIGFSKEAYCVKDPMGISMGGSGLMASPYDMLKVMYLISQDGCWQGKQLLPKEYLKEATKKQIDTFAKGPTCEEMQGYGYQFWCTRNAGYVCYGMGGQLMLVLPKKDMILITTADTQSRQGGVQLIYDAFWQELYGKVQEEALAENPSACKKLRDEWGIRELIVPAGQGSSPLLQRINGAVYHMDENTRGFDEIRLRFSETEGEFLYYSRTALKEEKKISFGLGTNKVSIMKPYGCRIAASGIWRSENTFFIRINILDECIATIFIQLVFKGDTVTVFMKKYEESAFKEFDGFLSGRMQDTKRTAVDESKERN